MEVEQQTVNLVKLLDECVALTSDRRNRRLNKRRNMDNFSEQILLRWTRSTERPKDFNPITKSQSQRRETAA